MTNHKLSSVGVDKYHLLVRPMRLQDIPAVREIDTLSFALPWSERAYRFEILDNAHSRCWVAEVTLPTGEVLIVGMMVIWLILDEAHIATIAIHPEYRRMGIARKMLCIALDDLIDRGASTATLEVREGNIPAISLYKKFGFKVAGKRERYYQDNNENALIMTLYHLDDAYRHWIREGAPGTWKGD